MYFKKKLTQRIIDKSDNVVVLSHKSKELLQNMYKVDGSKVATIYLGFPDLSFNCAQTYKDMLSVKSKYMCLMTGLLGPGKGTEYVIKAMRTIVDSYKDIMFFVIGQTHPTVLKSEGEKYRKSLEALVEKLNLKNNVTFVNRFVSGKEYIEYYKASDFCLTPHIDPQQSSSVTLSYGLAAGKVCISTPFLYAQEMLDNNAGIIVPFRDSISIAKAILEVISNEESKKMYEKMLI